MSSGNSAEPVIAFEDVHLGFDEGDVLRGLTFHVVPQETKVIVGESGSGKTLAMKLAAGLLRPDSGRITVLGRDVTQMDEGELLDFRRNIGFVFQEGALFDSMTVADNVAFRLLEENSDDAEIDQRVREALSFVEMDHAIDKLPSELSGGMRRRVSIARALISKPEVVFYDSPTAGLDPVTSQTIITLVLRLRDLQGVTAMLATHRLQDAFSLANFQFDEKTQHVIRASSNGHPPASSTASRPSAATTFVFLREGRAYFEGGTDDVLKSTDPYLQQFLADAKS